jgi:HEAT repeat protein
LAGLKNAPPSLLPKLLQDVVLSEGEEVFLAARMLREHGEDEDEDENIDYLRNYVVGALLTRLDVQREPHAQFRAQAADALGYLGGENAVRRLIAIAIEKVRGSPEDPTFEYSTVRLAAMLALRRILVPPYDEIAQHNEALAEIFRCWKAGNVEALKTFLHRDASEEDDGIQALTAFVLGDLGTEEAVDVLVEAFLAPDQDKSLYRNVSTALTLVDPAEVIQRVVLPLIDETEGDPSNVGVRLANLIYLIGRLRAPAKEAQDFLKRCLIGCAPIKLKGLVIQSLGWLHAETYKADLESIALGDFEALRLVGPLPDSNRRYLQRKALEALVYLGDTSTLKQLRQRAFTWDPDLELAFYRTSEEILARGKEAARHA